MNYPYSDFRFSMKVKSHVRSYGSFIFNYLLLESYGVGSIFSSVLFLLVLYQLKKKVNK